MTFEIVLEGRIIAGTNDDALTRYLDQAMERFIAAGVKDPAIGSMMAAGTVEIGLVVVAESLQSALSSGASLIGDALAGNAPAGEPVEWHRLEARRIAAIPA